MIKTLSQEFNLSKKQAHELGSIQSLGSWRDGGIIRPFAPEGVTISRVSKFELESIYFKNSIIRNSIRNKVQMIGASGYRILYNNRKEERSFQEFFDGLGQIGDDCDFDQIYLGVPKSQFIFGASWNELIWDEDDEEIVDVNRLDAKRMDYARTKKQEIIVGRDQRPIGYTMKVFSDVNFGQKNLTLGDPIPKEYKGVVDLGSDKIFLLPKRIALIRFEEEGDGLEYWGLVETVYKDALRKGKLEEAGFNSAFQRWMAPLYAKIGDDRHPPTPQLAKQTLDTMKKMKHDLLSTFPYFVDLKTLDANDLGIYIDMVKSLRENEASGLQTPMPFAMSSGETTNRATLNNQQAMLEFGLNELVRINAKLITKRIFRKVAESKGLKTWPKLIPNRISVDEIDDRAIRYGMFVEKGIFSPDEVRPILAEVEGIELINVPDKQNSNKTKDKQKKPGKDKIDEKDDEDSEDTLYDKNYEEPWKTKQL